jgi:WD40 repeat protein
MTSSRFASVADDGRIEIWDLKDSLTPLITHFDKDSEGNAVHTPKTIVRFSATSPVILTGNVQGEVDVYRSKGLEHV